LKLDVKRGDVIDTTRGEPDLRVGQKKGGEGCLQGVRPPKFLPQGIKKQLLGGRLPCLWGGKRGSHQLEKRTGMLEEWSKTCYSSSSQSWYDYSGMTGRPVKQGGQGIKKKINNTKVEEGGEDARVTSADRPSKNLIVTKTKYKSRGWEKGT